MSIYTVHEPPVRTANPLSDAERLVFVRDGFAFWAFIAAPLWMLWHRMWVVLVGYVLVMVIFIAGLAALGASRTALVVVGLFISLLVGLESSTLRRFTLRRRGWANLGIVSGDDVEDAERRFFGVWLRQAPSQSAANAVPPPPAPRPTAPPPRMAQTPNVVGLFPEPGGQL